MMKTDVAIKNLQTRVPISPSRLTVITKKVLKSFKLKSVHLSLVFVCDRRIKTLNKKYLHHDFATDVLAFDFSGDSSARGILDGEIIISTETAVRNAKVYQTTFQNEIVLYVIHGILHLLGYDDHSVSQIKRMRKKEQEILRKIFGSPVPSSQSPD